MLLVGTFNLEFWIQFKFWVLGEGDVGLRSFLQDRRMWPQALGIRRPWGSGELGPVQGMVEGGV